MSPRRFPPPWSAELQPNYYVVRDAEGQQLAYIARRIARRAKLSQRRSDIEAGIRPFTLSVKPRDLIGATK
jgi:hypothetical protein